MGTEKIVNQFGFVPRW